MLSKYIKIFFNLFVCSSIYFLFINTVFSEEKLTTEEIQWASEVERWDCEEVVAILRFIALTQPLRT